MSARPNPKNHGTIAWWGIISISAFAVGIIWVYLDHGFIPWFGWPFGIAIALFIFSVPLDLEFRRRPYAVEITDSGIIVYQNLWRKPAYVNWSDIERLYLADIQPDERGFFTRDGSLVPKGKKKYYKLHWKLAAEIREAYRTKMGCYPPN